MSPSPDALAVPVGDICKDQLPNTHPPPRETTRTHPHRIAPIAPLHCIAAEADEE